MSLFLTGLLGTALLFAVTTVIAILLISAAPQIEDDDPARRLKGGKAEERKRSTKVDWTHFDRVALRRQNRHEETTASRDR